MGERLIIGAMSGTSADGVDAALVRVSGNGLSMSASLLHHHHQPYDDALRRTIFDLRASGKTELRSLADLTRKITLEHADAVAELLSASQTSADKIEAIAVHGQTVFHDPPMTIQCFDPSLLANRVGCTVVSDFRRADCAAGGQGAPLVPFADYILFRHPDKNRVLLNIGGIANLTWLKAGESIAEVIAFDTGPGNCISDWLSRTLGPAGLNCDTGGKGALSGKVIEPVATQFLAEPYFAAPAPKSADIPAMIAAFAKAVGDTHYSTHDLLATAAHVTAAAVSQAVKSCCGDLPLELIVSGGGIHNQAIMGGLKSMAGWRTVFLTSDELHICSDAKEAVAFALLGAATLEGIASNVPSVTGAKRPVVLGSITPRP